MLSYIQENSFFFFWQMNLLFGRIEPRQMPTWAGCVPASNTMNKAMQGKRKMKWCVLPVEQHTLLAYI